MMNIFLPCRAGSQRVPKKNTKDFAGIKGGLVTIKIKQLLALEGINKIVVSTDDEVIRDIVLAFNNSKLIIDKRPANLASSDTSTDDLIKYVPKIINSGHVLWTHVTSPFLDQKIYKKAIDVYYKGLEDGFDSLMTVTKIQSFLWSKKGSFNYDRTIEKWPRTQTIDPLYEVNSGIFISSRSNYKKFNDRIGDNPRLYETNGISAFDIDWPEDFLLAEKLFLADKKK